MPAEIETEVTAPDRGPVWTSPKPDARLDDRLSVHVGSRYLKAD
jgi:hypothetical protein